jgi:hypothetical protein
MPTGKPWKWELLQLAEKIKKVSQKCKIRYGKKFLNGPPKRDFE